MKNILMPVFLTFSLMCVNANAEQYLVISKDTGWQSSNYGWYFIERIANGGEALEQWTQDRADFKWGTFTNYNINVEISSQLSGIEVQEHSGICRIDIGEDMYSEYLAAGPQPVTGSSVGGAIAAGIQEAVRYWEASNTDQRKYTLALRECMEILYPEFF